MTQHPPVARVLRVGTLVLLAVLLFAFSGCAMQSAAL